MEGRCRRVRGKRWKVILKWELEVAHCLRAKKHDLWKEL